jgi:hypothetical protein
MDQQRTKAGEREDLRDLNKKYRWQVSERRAAN